MVSDGATRIIEDLGAARGDLRARVEELRKTRGDDVMVGDWMVREMLGHVGFWTEAAVPVITYMWRAKDIPDGWQFGSGYRGDNSQPWPPFMVHNAREGAWAKGQTFEAVLD